MIKQSKTIDNKTCSIDHFRCFSERSKMLFFNTVSVGLVGFLIAGLSFIPQSHHYFSVVLFSIIFGCLALNCAGFYKCATLHTRQYAHVVISTIQWMKSVALITGPALVAAIVKNEESVGQWRIVLCIIGAVLVTVRMQFCLSEASELSGQHHSSLRLHRQACRVHNVPYRKDCQV